MKVQSSRDKFFWTSERPQDFVLTQWRRDRSSVGGVFLSYRAVMFAFVVVNYVLNLLTIDYRPYFLIYLTNHGLTLILAEQACGLSLVVYCYVRQSRDEGFDLSE